MRTTHHKHWVMICGFVLACSLPLPAQAIEGQALHPAVREIETPAPFGSRQHRLATAPDGRLLLSWVEEATDRTGAAIRYATREGQVWSQPRTVVTVHDKLADGPVVMGLTDGTLAASWMVSRSTPESPYAADLYLARSRDDGQIWTQPIKPYGKAARIYDAQMSPSALADGKLALIWTDQRGIRQLPQGGSEGSYRLMATVVDGNGTPGPERLLDDDICSCCSVGSAAQGQQVLTVYRDHRAGEVRDITVVRWGQDGSSAPRLLHDDQFVINGCPSNGPAIATWKSRAVAAWFAAPGGQGRAQAAFSTDGGANFGKPVVLDTDAVGYVDALLLDDGSALVSWRARQADSPDQKLRVAGVSPHAGVTGTLTVHVGSFDKWPSKYPYMKRAGDHVLLAWTDPEQKRVRVVSFPLDALALAPAVTGRIAAE
ncbi:MAG: hypothetical protein ACRDS9_26240 [Pseudonocardiaceae bacterium]